jgi:ABC-2 type transport system ATP-binding protein
MNKVISVENLSKSFKEKEVLKGISFDIHSRDCVALIGPNGAGKTVLMSCLLGDYLPTSGKIKILGKNGSDQSLKKEVGILFQENVTQEKVKVKELLDFQKAIYSNPLNDNEIDDYLGFNQEQKNQFAEKLSGGQRRLLSFVLVLIGQPDIIFLDEPTASMDTSTRKRFWEIINSLKAAGKTIIYSSHYIEEVEHTADRILVLHDGQLLRDTTPYLLRTEEKEKVFTLPEKYLPIIENQNITDLEIKFDTISFSTKHVSAIWKVLADKNCPLEDIEMTNRTLLNSIFDSEKEEKADYENL